MNKPTKEEMKNSIDKVKDRLRDKAYNGKDKEKDRLDSISKQESIKSKSFEIFKDNKKELDKFMYEFNLIDIYKFNITKYLVEYPFGNYPIMGKSSKENQQDILDRYKKFMDMTNLTKLNLTKYEEFSYLQHPKIISKARRLRDNYLLADVDTRCFVPEFIFGVPLTYVDEYFLMFLVINNLCDGLLEPKLILNEVKDRLKLKAYPVIYLNREHGKKVSDKIRSSVGFIHNNTQYFSC